MKKVLFWIALVLVVIGAINWGLVGLFQFDVVFYLFTQTLALEIVSTIVYVAIGVAGLYLLLSNLSMCSCCKDSECCKPKVDSPKIEEDEEMPEEDM